MRLISILFVLFIFIAIVFLIPHSSASQIIIVENTPIQEAINASQNGDVIVVKEGVYVEQLVINKNISLVGVGNATLLDDSLHKSWENYTGICIFNASASVRNFTIRGFVIGVSIISCSNAVVQNSTVANNTYGVYVKYSNSTVVANNTFENNNKSVYGYASVSACIENNVFKNNLNGVVFEYNSNNTAVRGNIVMNNTNAVLLYGSSNSTISGNKIANNTQGVYLGSSPEANLTNNMIANNTRGVSVASSRNVSLSFNNIINNTEYGLSSNTNVSVQDNYIANSAINGTTANISMSNVSTKLNLFQPVIERFSPFESANVTIDENMTLSFGVSAADADDDVLVYRWYKNGILVGDNDAYNFISNYSSAGVYNISVSVSDANYTICKNWTVVVKNVNRRPVVTSFSPDVNIAINEGVAQRFSVDVIEPDRESVSYSWYVDNVSATDTENYTEQYWNVSSKELHNVSVYTSDGNLSTQMMWTVTVNNVNMRPKAIIDSVSTKDNRTFTLTGHGEDADGTISNYSWSYKGGSLGNGSVMNVSLFSRGMYTIFFNVQDNDGGWSENASVNVTVVSVIGDVVEVETFLYVGGLVAIVVAIVAVVWWVRRS